MDSLIQSQPASAGVSSFVVIAVWAAAIVAAVLATVRRAQGTAELREQLQGLERKLATPVQPAGAAGAPRATPKFGATFYESSPSFSERLLSWPGAVPTVVAAVLGLAGGVLLLARTGSGAAEGAHYQQELSGLMASHDSLVLLVQGLRDSVRAVSQAPAATASTSPKPAATGAAGPKRRTAVAGEASKRVPAIPPAPGILPAAPALDPVASGASPKAPSSP